ncbi:MAG: RNA polymerase sigma factor [Candidatus Kapaibacterium sp.]
MALSSPIDSERENDLARSKSPNDDTILLERFFAGENAALVELYDRHNHRLYIYCLKLLGSPEQAEDLTQEVWERIARLRSKPQTIHNPIGFLLTIARNLCFNHLKSRKRFSPIDDVDEVETRLASTQTSRELSDLEELVVAALAEIPPDYREVLVLNLYCGYRLEEIATMLGKSADAIRKRASRARMQLRTIVMERIKTQEGTEMMAIAATAFGIGEEQQ